MPRALLRSTHRNHSSRGCVLVYLRRNLSNSRARHRPGRARSKTVSSEIEAVGNAKMLCIHSRRTPSGMAGTPTAREPVGATRRSLCASSARAQSRGRCALIHRSRHVRAYSPPRPASSSNASTRARTRSRGSPLAVCHICIAWGHSPTRRSVTRPRLCTAPTCSGAHARSSVTAARASSTTRCGAGTNTRCADGRERPCCPGSTTTGFKKKNYSSCARVGGAAVAGGVHRMPRRRSSRRCTARPSVPSCPGRRPGD